jgi:cyclopropane fatty-acyl-phospholipid synthase-like methyltransferase
MQKERWFEHWFDSPYYHILYKNRNTQEARANIDQLLQHLALKGGASILDLACGKGRYARYISEKGFHVTGYDLSPNNIAIAKEHQNANLHFEVRDMREDLGTAVFDVILNLFTSFGYFETREEHERCLAQIHMALKSGGVFVLDFLNAEKITHGLVPEEVITQNQIDFHIKRFREGHQIVKEIRFQANGTEHHYTERVMAFGVADFIAMFNKVGFHITHTLGGFDGHPFQPAISDRLIFIATK